MGNYKLLNKILCRFNELRRNYAASTSTTRTCCSCLANRSIIKKLAMWTTLLPLLVSSYATSRLHRSNWCLFYSMVSVFLSNGWSLVLGAAGLAAGLAPLFFVFPPSLLFASFSQFLTGSNEEFSDRLAFEQASSGCAAFASARLVNPRPSLFTKRGAQSPTAVF